MALSPGSRIGPYEFVNAIGAGGLGDVYRARDDKLGREVALKIPPDAVAVDPDRLARFEREARTLASLNHPHIAQIYGFEERGGTCALVASRPQFFVAPDGHRFLLNTVIEGDTTRPSSLILNWRPPQ